MIQSSSSHIADDQNEAGMGNHAAVGRFGQAEGPLQLPSKIDTPQFVGQLGGQGRNAVSRKTSNESLLKLVPDAAPLMGFRESFDLKPLSTLILWKSAVMEGVGTLLLVWITGYASISPSGPPPASTRLGISYDNPAFVGALVGSFLNFIFLTIFIFSFGSTSGAHLNPTITIATLFVGLCSFPRALLYLSFQAAGAALGGLLIRAAYGTRDYKVGGCWLYQEYVPTNQAFAVEFMTCLVLLFFAFGVGLDPRQRDTVGPTLAPFLVGGSLAGLSLATGYVRYGYGGPSLNPARCFGAYVGSYFPRYHWVHWVADISAGAIHALFYSLIPPWHFAAR
jgi:glycerol uptake facilitator-like aquaporin